MKSRDIFDQFRHLMSTHPVRDNYVIGDDLSWEAPWVHVSLWTELPFWLMVDNTTVTIEYDGHEFPVAIQDNYFQLFFGEATDSRASVGYCGPFKKREELSAAVREAMDQHPNGPYIWRKCKTYLKVGSRCNEDVLNAAAKRESPQRENGAKLYLSELCRAHIPVINKLIKAYRLATYDYFAFNVSPWDVPLWTIDHDGSAISATLVQYREWDVKPLIFNFKNPTPTEDAQVYRLIKADELQNHISIVATPGELELLDALNLMERGDYSGAVRRVTTAIEVIVEYKTGEAMEKSKGKLAAEKFLLNTRMRFDERIKRYGELTGRTLSSPLLKTLKETRSLRHRIVHGGYRIGPSERGRAQKAVDTGRWTFNWFEDDAARRDIREKRIAFRSLGRDLSAGAFRPRITPDGVVLSSIRETIGKPPK